MDTVTRNKSIRDYYASILDRYNAELEKSLPNVINVDRFKQVALITITKKPHLFNCTKASVIGVIMTAASLGLYIDDDLGECFIDQVYNDLTKKYEAQIIIGYQGLCVLAMRSGFVDYMQPRYVCDGDEFEYEYGLDDVLRHKPTAADRSNDKITHFYVVVKLKTGSKIFNVMTRKEVEDVRDGSKFYKTAAKKEDTVWHIYFNKMGNKTVLRSLTKYIPLSPEMQLAVKLDEQLEYGAQDLYKAALELPNLDDDITQEAILDRQHEKEEQNKYKSKDRNKKKVNEALESLKNITSKKATAILAALFLFSSCDKDKEAATPVAPKYCFECTKSIEYNTGAGTAPDVIKTYENFCNLTEAQIKALERSNTKQVAYNGLIANQSYNCLKR